MTGLLFGGILLSVVIAWCTLARRQSEQDSSVLVLLLVLAPAGLFTSVTVYALTTVSPGHYRVALEGFEVALGAQDTVTIGGGNSGDAAARRDHLCSRIEREPVSVTDNNCRLLPGV